MVIIAKAGKHHHQRSAAGSSSTSLTSASILTYCLPLTFILGYALLEKKLLPRTLWRPLSRLYFYPLMLPNLLWRTFFMKQPYFSDVDSGLMLGAVPMVCAGHVKALHADGVWPGHQPSGLVLRSNCGLRGDAAPDSAAMDSHHRPHRADG